MKRLKSIGEILIGLAAITLLLTQLVVVGSQYGTRWELRRWYMPHSLLSPDGRTYADGRWVDSFTMLMVHYDCEEEAYLVWTGSMLFVICLNVRSRRRQRQSQREKALLLARLIKLKHKLLQNGATRGGGS